MNSIFSKVIIFFASILTVFSGANYIQLGTDNLTFDFKTGENYPIYYFLNVQNIGPGKERFEISSDQSWISGYREGTDYTFVELPSQAYVNFILTIRPEQLPDGVNEAKINLRVLDIESLASQELVLDQGEIPIILNKNIVPAPTLPILSPTSSEEQNRGSSISPPSPEGSGEIGTAPTSTLIPQPTQTLETAPVDLSPVLRQIQSLIDSIRMFLENFF